MAITDTTTSGVVLQIRNNGEDRLGYFPSDNLKNAAYSRDRVMAFLQEQFPSDPVAAVEHLFKAAMVVADLLPVDEVMRLHSRLGFEMRQRAMGRGK